MKVISFLLAVAISFQSSTLQLRIGSIVPREDIAEFSTSSLILHNGDLKPSIMKVIDNVSYRIAYDERSRRIVQISTFDEDFQTADGVHTGSYVEVRREQIIPTESSDILGLRTSDGWHTVLGTDFEIIVERNGVDRRVRLCEDWRVRSARRGINRLFANTRTIIVRVERFSRIRE